MKIILEQPEPPESALDHIIPGTQEVQQEVAAFDQTILTGPLADDRIWQPQTNEAPEGVLDFDPQKADDAIQSNADTRCPGVN